MDLARRAGLTALDAHVFEGGPFVLRWVHGVCFSPWWRGFVGGSLDGVKRSTRPCWTGSLVGPCVLLSRRVFLFWWLLVVGIVRLWGMNKGGLSACAAPANRVDGRAAAACLCGAESPSPVFVVARRRVSSFSREGDSDAVIFPRSVVAPLVCKESRVCIRTHRHGAYYYDYVIAPGSGRGLAAATARPSEESV